MKTLIRAEIAHSGDIRTLGTTRQQVWQPQSGCVATRHLLGRLVLCLPSQQRPVITLRSGLASMIDPKLLDAMVEAGCRSLYQGWAMMQDYPGSTEKSDRRQVVLDIILAALRAAEAWPEPHKLVGREATAKQHNAAMDRITKEAGELYSDIWSAMFDAAPGIERQGNE